MLDAQMFRLETRTTGQLDQDEHTSRSQRGEHAPQHFSGIGDVMQRQRRPRHVNTCRDVGGPVVVQVEKVTFNPLRDSRFCGGRCGAVEQFRGYVESMRPSGRKAAGQLDRIGPGS